MPDSRFYASGPPIAADEAARVAGARLEAGTVAPGAIARVAAPDEEALADAAIFIADKAALTGLGARRFGLCLVSEALAPLVAAQGPLAVCADPRSGFAALAARLHAEIAPRRGPAREGTEIDPSAWIDATAEIGADAVIGPFAVIGPGVVIADGVHVGAHASIHCAIIGAGARIAAGARIGGAGFGFAQGPHGLVRIPQLGRVIIGAHAEIGANSCIDRGALGDTVVGPGAKIDNLVQIGHNVRVGAHAVLASQTGIAGSSSVGEGALLGGQVGVADHVAIGAGARIGAQAGLMRDVPPGETWGGYPARPMRLWMKEIAMLARLVAGKKSGKDQ